MSARLVTFSICFSASMYAAVLLWLGSCQSDRNAGRVAARITGASAAMVFERDGREDTAAMFPFAGMWWIYHPDLGSRCTFITIDQPAPRWVHLWLDGVKGAPHFEPVRDGPVDADLALGCLPRAIADVRAHGGSLRITPGAPGQLGHIERVAR